MMDPEAVVACAVTSASSMSHQQSADDSGRYNPGKRFHPITFNE
jgi:hypothetical protein